MQLAYLVKTDNRANVDQCSLRKQHGSFWESSKGYSILHNVGLPGTARASSRRGIHSTRILNKGTKQTNNDASTCGGFVLTFRPFPHPIGLYPEPLSYPVRALSGVDFEVGRKVMSANAAKVYSIPVSSRLWKKDS